MTVTMILALILFLLMIGIGGVKGFGAFISLWINFGILFAMIMMINWGFNIFVILLFGSLLVLLITILSAGADEETTTIAMLASMIVMVVLVAIIFPMEHLNLAQGFAVENSEELESLSLQIGLNFVNIGIVAALLATLGAIAEASIAITSGFDEIASHHPEMSLVDLLKAGAHLGQQIVGTAVNTVLFGFMADFLSLGVMFAKLNYSFGDILNSKLFVASMLAMLYAFLGVILVLPVSLLLIRIRRNRVQSDK